MGYGGKCRFCKEEIYYDHYDPPHQCSNQRARAKQIKYQKQREAELRQEQEQRKKDKQDKQDYIENLFNVLGIETGDFDSEDDLLLYMLEEIQLLRQLTEEYK